MSWFQILLSISTCAATPWLRPQLPWRPGRGVIQNKLSTVVGLLSFDCLLIVYPYASASPSPTAEIPLPAPVPPPRVCMSIHHEVNPEVTLRSRFDVPALVGYDHAARATPSAPRASARSPASPPRWGQPDCLLIVRQCTRTRSPHPPPWSGHPFPLQLNLTVQVVPGLGALVSALEITMSRSASQVLLSISWCAPTPRSASCAPAFTSSSSSW